MQRSTCLSPFCGEQTLYRAPICPACGRPTFGDEELARRGRHVLELGVILASTMAAVVWMLACGSVGWQAARQSRRVGGKCAARHRRARRHATHGTRARRERSTDGPGTIEPVEHAARHNAFRGGTVRDQRFRCSRLSTLIFGARGASNADPDQFAGILPRFYGSLAQPAIDRCVSPALDTGDDDGRRPT